VVGGVGGIPARHAIGIERNPGDGCWSAFPFFFSIDDRVMADLGDPGLPLLQVRQSIARPQNNNKKRIKNPMFDPSCKNATEI
jgi:hypothetical protein